MINQEIPQQGNNENDDNNVSNNDVSENNQGNETPLINGETQSNNDLLIVGSCGILMVAILIGLFLLKKKNNAVNKG